MHYFVRVDQTASTSVDVQNLKEAGSCLVLRGSFLLLPRSFTSVKQETEQLQCVVWS